jgi:hypothetical protein
MRFACNYQRPEITHINSPVDVSKSRFRTHFEMFQNYKNILSAYNINKVASKAEESVNHKNILENLVGSSVTEQALRIQNSQAINNLKIFDKLFRR